MVELDGAVGGGRVVLPNFNGRRSTTEPEPPLGQPGPDATWVHNDGDKDHVPYTKQPLRRDAVQPRRRLPRT